MDQKRNKYLGKDLQNQQKNAQEGKKKNKRLQKAAAVTAIAIVFVLILAGDFILDLTRMPHGLYIYGESVSGMTIEHAAEKIEKKFMDTELVFTENGEELYRTTVGDAGFSLDEAALEEELQLIQSTLLKKRGLFETRKNIAVGCTLDVDDWALSAALSADNFEVALEREESTDAYLQYDSEKEEYVVVPSWQGDAIDEEKLRTVVLEKMDEELEENLFPELVSVRLDVNSYETVNITEDEEELQEELEVLNQNLSDYRDTTIVYTFGSSSEILDSSTIMSWLRITSDSVEMNTDEVWTYIDYLADKYDTLDKIRQFTTIDGTLITVEDNEYGFMIDKDAEFWQLMEDLESGTTVTRDPVYSVAGLQRDGTDDLAGSYIEVSLDEQRLWLYRDYALIYETDIVSGQPTEDRATLQGAWPIAYKVTDYTLSSDYYGYATHVNYWMPFADGQGLHDAIWQSSFGGTRYLTSGSHGCINLSLEAAAEIYNDITEGYPIIIYSK